MKQSSSFFSAWLPTAQTALAIQTEIMKHWAVTLERAAIDAVNSDGLEGDPAPALQQRYVYYPVQAEAHSTEQVEVGVSDTAITPDSPADDAVVGQLSAAAAGGVAEYGADTGTYGQVDGYYNGTWEGGDPAGGDGDYAAQQQVEFLGGDAGTAVATTAAVPEADSNSQAYYEEAQGVVEGEAGYDDGSAAVGAEYGGAVEASGGGEEQWTGGQAADGSYDYNDPSYYPADTSTTAVSWEPIGSGGGDALYVRALADYTARYRGAGSVPRFTMQPLTCVCTLYVCVFTVRRVS